MKKSNDLTTFLTTYCICHKFTAWDNCFVYNDMDDYLEWFSFEDLFLMYVLHNKIRCWDIYVVRNTVNDKVYVGQSVKGIKKRFSKHIRDTKGDCLKLWRALNKYNRDKFYPELLDICFTQQIADRLENFYIIDFDSIKNGYNIREGGHTGKLSPESIAKMSKSKTGKTASEETKKKLSDSIKGENHYNATINLKTVKQIRKIK